MSSANVIKVTGFRFCPKHRGIMFGDGDEYCWECGRPLATQVVCGCGHIPSEGHKYCPKCGKKIRIIVRNVSIGLPRGEPGGSEK